MAALRTDAEVKAAMTKCGEKIDELTDRLSRIDHQTDTLIKERAKVDKQRDDEIERWDEIRDKGYDRGSRG